MSSSSSITIPLEKSQYHHFIPRFILRNYSHPESQPPTPKPKPKHKNRRKNTRPRPPEPMLWGINLTTPEPRITETPVAKTFGMIDMYRDISASTRQHYIEEQLSILESRAGEIISQIRKTFKNTRTTRSNLENQKTEQTKVKEGSEKIVWLTRPQRDTLRKFIFIMKYRGSRFHRRYFHERAADYCEDDTELMMAYMKEKGFVRPVDVWFDNIKGILELKLDTAGLWMENIHKRIFPPDAEWFINNLQGFYMAIVTPEEADVGEFLLTQNAYGIFEGATSEKMNLVTGKMERSVYSEFHLFAPIAPRLLIVLRTSLLPEPAEDRNPRIKIGREMLYHAHAIQHTYPHLIGTLLRDLPIGKALNSYSKVVNGEMVMVNGCPVGAKDRFGFRFFEISEAFVQRINEIMLEESYNIDLIVFNGREAAKKTILSYLAGRSEVDVDIERVRFIRKLKSAVERLGGEELVGEVTNLPIRKETDRERIPDDKVHALFMQDKYATELYLQLSGKTHLDGADFSEARDLLYKRIKLNGFTHFAPPQACEHARQQFLTLYEEFPAQVIWIYLKRIRFMNLGGTMIGTSNILEDEALPAEHLAGMEDVVVVHQIRIQTYADHEMHDSIDRKVFRQESLRRMMHHVSMNAALLAKPTWGLTSALILDENGKKQFAEEMVLVLGHQGSICDCGIPNVEEAARTMRRLLKARSYKPWEYSISPIEDVFSLEEKLELFLRPLVRKYKEETTGKSLIDDPVLENIVFDILYPIFGARQERESRSNNEEGGKNMNEIEKPDDEDLLDKEKVPNTEDSKSTCLIQ